MDKYLHLHKRVVCNYSSMPRLIIPLAKLPVKLRHGWVITSHMTLWMQLFIHVLYSVTHAGNKGPSTTGKRDVLLEGKSWEGGELSKVQPKILNPRVPKICDPVIEKCWIRGHMRYPFLVIIMCFDEYIRSFSFILRVWREEGKKCWLPVQPNFWKVLQPSYNSALGQ